MGKCQCRQPCLSIATTALCHSSGGKPASLSFLCQTPALYTNLLLSPSWSSLGTAQAYLDIIWTHLLQVTLSPWKPWLSPRGSLQSFRRASLRLPTASGCPQTSQRDSLAMAARSIWKHPLFYCYGKARKGDCQAVSPTPRTSQKSRCPIWDFPVSSLWLGACPPHLVGWGGVA